jgi:hypothetical protein
LNAIGRALLVIFAVLFLGATVIAAMNIGDDPPRRPVTHVPAPTHNR